jgi:hypothetical protein
MIACEKGIDYRAPGRPVVFIPSSDARYQSDSVHLSSDTVYVLTGDMNIRSGQKLHIEAGTLIRIDNQVGINFALGSSLKADGTDRSPIVFTANAAKGTQGRGNAWNGISIEGDSVSRFQFSYARVEFTLSNRPALTLRNLGSKNDIHHIQVSYPQSAHAISLQGGKLEPHHLIVYAAVGTDYQITQGYVGRMQFLVSYKHPNLAAQLGSPRTIAGFLIEGRNTFPYLSNLTIMGPDITSAVATEYFDTLAGFSGARVAAMVVSAQARFQCYNSVLAAYPKTALYVDENATARALHLGPSFFKYNMVQSYDTIRSFFVPVGVYPIYDQFDFRSFMLESRWGNTWYPQATDFAFSDPYDYDGKPSLFPDPGSPLLKGAQFTDSVLQTSYFRKVSFKGAFGDQQWEQGWSLYTPLQQDYEY